MRPSPALGRLSLARMRAGASGAREQVLGMAMDCPLHPALVRSQH